MRVRSASPLPKDVRSLQSRFYIFVTALTLYMYIALESREPKGGDEIGGLFMVLVPVLSL
jgi:hypothetical protein